DEGYRRGMREHVPTPDDTTADAVSFGAVQMAYSLSADLIVTFTSSGSTALRVSRNRPGAPILAITPTLRAYRQLAVAWGVVPN
ncbi:pyruvate kinase, partial [Enterococcus hirae]